jgi:ABC-type phosphate transport system auxiliary subunit
MSKITEQELEQLKDQESKKAQIANEVGILEARKHQLLHLLDNLLEEQSKTKTLLEDKYGRINVDLKDGSYKPIEEAAE